MFTHHILINGDSRNLSKIADNSVHLIITSPPYWQLKDYGSKQQIGFNETYEQYINSLNIVWSECFRVLQDGCRLCINIGDQFARSVYYGRYKVIPIHSEIIRFCEMLGFDYMGNIIWQKPTSMHTTGGANVMGTYPYPRGGIIKIDFEYILIFKKQGKAHKATREQRDASILTDSEWNTYFSGHWQIKGEHQDRHLAVFPKEIPSRLIKMFSYVGDTVFDPFMGSGTTALAACELHRNSIGYEINSKFRLFYQEKVIDSNSSSFNTFEITTDTSAFDINFKLKSLPYLFVDTHKLHIKNDYPSNTFGSKISIDKNIQQELLENVIPDTQLSLKQLESPTVLLNHVAKEQVELTIKLGLTYLRAGDSKGSLLVQKGFERLGYVLLHTNGDNAQLFKLTKKGFQIWTAKNLQALGFSAENAPYYAVLRFDASKSIPYDQTINLKQRAYTNVAKIRPLSDFVGVK